MKKNEGKEFQALRELRSAFHNGHERFLEILLEEARLYDEKNHD